MILPLILKYCFFFLYVFILPGYLISKLLFKKIKTYEIASFSMTFGFIVLSWIFFSLAWIFKTYISVGLVLIVTTIINIILIYINIKKGWKLDKIKVNKKYVALIVMCIFIFSIHFMNFQGPAKDYWSTYIVAGSMFLSNDKIEFVDINNKELYDYELKGNIPENLVDENSYGIITKDQRIGASVIYSLPYVLFGLAGFRLFHALILVLCFLFIYSITKSLFKSEIVGLITGLVIVLNPLLFYFNRLNANIISLLIIFTIIFLLLNNEKNIFLVGLFYGILGGVRNVAIIFLPAILIFLLMEKKDINYRLKNIGYFVFGSFITILPILIWKAFAFGSILAHPTQHPGLYGYRPTFEHNFIGFKFLFNGLLNYPFYDTIVRTPHFPFPNFITMPLLLIRSFGLLFVGLGCIGAYFLRKYKKRLGFLCLVLFVPFFIFLMFQENWEELKTSFLILILPPISIFIGMGLSAFISKIKNKDYKKALFSLLIILALIYSSVFMLKFIDYKVDERWYERFPHSLKDEINMSVLSNELRLDWQFFYTKDTLEEYEIQKEKYTDVWILPRLYSKLHVNNFSVGTFYSNVDKKELKTLEVWNYIYG